MMNLLNPLGFLGGGGGLPILVMLFLGINSIIRAIFGAIFPTPAA